MKLDNVSKTDTILAFRTPLQGLLNPKFSAKKLEEEKDEEEGEEEKK